MDRIGWSRWKVAMASVGMVALLSGCGCTVFEWAEQRAQWEEAEPEAYAYTVRIICFCAPEVTAPVRVEVRDGQPVSITRVDDEEPANQSLFGRYDTIDEIFDLVADAYEQHAHEVNVAYDANFGFPTEVYIDYIELAVDEELGVEITDFEVLHQEDERGALETTP